MEEENTVEQIEVTTMEEDIEHLKYIDGIKKNRNQTER